MRDYIEKKIAECDKANERISAQLGYLAGRLDSYKDVLKAYDDWDAEVEYDLDAKDEMGAAVIEALENEADPRSDDEIAAEVIANIDADIPENPDE